MARAQDTGTSSSTREKLSAKGEKGGQRRLKTKANFRSPFSPSVSLSLSLSLAFPAFPAVGDVQDIRANAASQRDAVSAALGNYLLRGYCMLAEECSTCGVRIYRFRAIAQFRARLRNFARILVEIVYAESLE